MSKRIATNSKCTFGGNQMLGVNSKTAKKIMWSEKIGNMIVNAITEGKDDDFILQLTKTLIKTCREDLEVDAE